MAASFTFTSDCIVLELQPNSVVPNGLRQRTKNVSHRLLPLVHTPEPASQHVDPSTAARWVGLL